MKKAGEISVHELTAIDELIAAYRLSLGEPIARDDDLGIPLRPRHGAIESGAGHRMDLLAKFEQWKRDLAGTRALAAALGVLIDESPMRELERERRWRSGSAKQNLRAAIRHFAALRGNAPRGARGWKMRPNPTTDILNEAIRRARIER